MFISKKELERLKAETWQQGFDTGRKKAVTETRKVFIKLITSEIQEQTSSATRGLQRAVEIIRKGKR
jgi:hypothetical protein